MSHHRIALLVIAVAAVLDGGLGLGYAAAEHLPAWHGLFCGLANAVTDGGDVAPTNAAGYAITAAEYLLVVPLFAATFSLFTSGLSAIHIRRLHKRLDDLGTPPESAAPELAKLSEDVAGLAEAVRVAAGQPVRLEWTADAPKEIEFVAWLKKYVRVKGAAGAAPR